MACGFRRRVFIELSLKRINTLNSKHIMLHLSKHADREWTPRELKQELGLKIDENEIKKLLQNMFRADLIQRGSSDIKRSLQGMINHLSGMMAEYLLFNEFRSKKRFRLSRYFENVEDDAQLNIVDAATRVKFQRPDGKAMEIDVMAESACGRLLVMEVKKTPTQMGLSVVEDFLEKVLVFADLRPENVVLPAFRPTSQQTMR